MVMLFANNSNLVFFIFNCSLIVVLVQSLGFFELQLTRRNSDLFKNEKLFLKVCLKEVSNNYYIQRQSLIEDNLCTFGLKSLELKSKQLTLIKLPFTFRWTGAFSLLIQSDSQSLTESQVPPTPSHVHVLSEQRAPPSANWTQPEEQPLHFQFKYRITCQENYFGRDCATFCRSRDDSFGHFRCEEESGRKQCLKGWKGDTCDTPKCRENCNEIHGFCSEPEECTCRNGWKGVNCDQCVEYPGCLHGYCVKPFECLCHQKWGGVLCDQDLDFCHTHRPCANQGTCVNLRPPNLYKCQCKPGFEGANCQTVVDACATQPCLHQSTCTSRDNGTRFQCTCAKGFGGTRCELDVNECESNPCLNHGTCLDMTSGHFRCQCPHGLTGSRCETDVDECHVTASPCVHATSCLNTFGGFQCLCEKGFEGKFCEQEVNDCLLNDVICQNGGQCLDLLNDFRCICVNPFSGQNCQQLDENLCKNEDNALSWRLNANHVCLCLDKELKCFHSTLNATSGHNFRCQPSVRIVFSTHVQNACQTLLTLHSLISGKSEEFCCSQDLSETSILFYSKYSEKIKEYLISGHFWPEFQQFLPINDVNRSQENFETIFILISIVFSITLSIIIIIVVKKKFRRQQDISGEEDNGNGRQEVVINCIQNNLREEKRKNCKSLEKSLFLKI